MRLTKRDLMQPTTHPTGSHERVELYRLRKAAGLPLHVAGDSTETVAIAFTYEKIPPRAGLVVRSVISIPPE
jgi:hypothetical protein